MNKIQSYTLKLVPFSGLLYFAFQMVLSRECYYLLRINHQRKIVSAMEGMRISPNSYTKIKKGFRKKLDSDIKYHKLTQNWNVNTITQVLINNEGKITGYKLYSMYQPNYFTRNQPVNLIKKVEKFRFKKINLQIVNVKVQNNKD